MTASLCTCGEVLVENGRNAVHTDGFYRCPRSNGLGTGWATPVVEQEYPGQDWETAHTKALEAARSQGYAEALHEARYALESL